MNHVDLSSYDIFSDQTSYVYQPSYETLFELEQDPSLAPNELGVLTSLDAVSVDTGAFTGRTPRDKYVLMDHTTDHSVWWTSARYPNDNKPISPEIWTHLLNLVSTYLNGKKLYVVDLFCGNDPQYRRKVRIVTEIAWQAHFAMNMFVRPSDEELESFGDPDFVVLCASRVTNAEWKGQGLNSENFVAFNLEMGLQIIGGTWYGGEIKKGIFSMMNYFLPLKEVPTMHCAANQGDNGEVALFFGLSGTGKTTLSTDKGRRLIGDDEHGWGINGIFNLEGGCYAKTAKLDPDSEPHIYHAIRRNALLENVMVDEFGVVDFNDVSKTENGRVSYPIHHIDDVVDNLHPVGHANKIILLTADAFGVLPPVAKLTESQFLYHFLSGYTSKVSGTEQGVLSPIPTFSACYGAAFLSLHPMTYANLVLSKIRENHTSVYLVNTGWQGNGQRFPLAVTREIVRWILNDDTPLNGYDVLPVFELRVPQSIPGVDASFLDPRNRFKHTEEWEERAHKLADDFICNFERYDDLDSYRWIKKGGPLSTIVS